MENQIKYKNRVLCCRFNKKYLFLKVKGYLYNPQGYEIKNQRIVVIPGWEYPVSFPVKREKLGPVALLLRSKSVKVKIPTIELEQHTLPINTRPALVIDVEDGEVKYSLSMAKLRRHYNTRKYYIPFHSFFLGQYAFHMRCMKGGGLNIVKRPIDTYEMTDTYKRWENAFVSKTLYLVGKLIKKWSREQVYLGYEKEAKKAEEGTFELIQRLVQQEKKKAFFVIDSHSVDYHKISQFSFVIEKYSPKYYWLMYRANTYIATETPAHLNVLRSNNRWMRASAIENKFVFLQHGITYMKSQTKASTFGKGKEGEVSYCVVSSHKEGEKVAKMLQIEIQKLLNTGMAVYDQLDYGSITEESQDFVTVMLTWRPYEEQILDFEETSYYRELTNLYHILLTHVKEEQILIVAHPKIQEALQRTPIAGRIWKGTILDVTKQTKLLITDYSSVCYQCFYVGAGVIFYQYDLMKFEEEVGQLIPNDDEYIGPRVLHRMDLEEELVRNIQKGRIRLDRLRTEKRCFQYQQINEWHDGNNTQRICEMLQQKKI